MKLFEHSKNLKSHLLENSFTKEAEKTAAQKEEEKVGCCRGYPRGRLPTLELGGVVKWRRIAGKISSR